MGFVRRSRLPAVLAADSKALSARPHKLAGGQRLRIASMGNRTPDSFYDAQQPRRSWIASRNWEPTILRLCDYAGGQHSPVEHEGSARRVCDLDWMVQPPTDLAPATTCAGHLIPKSRQPGKLFPNPDAGLWANRSAAAAWTIVQGWDRRRLVPETVEVSEQDLFPFIPIFLETSG